VTLSLDRPVLMARRVLEMVRILHRQGHERLRANPGFSGAGWWQVRIGPLGPSRDDLGVWYTTASRDRVFGWEGAERSSPHALADRFRHAYPDIVAAASGADPAYADWFNDVLTRTAPDGLFWRYADWAYDERYVYSVNTPHELTFPLPPTP
jgi:hypothetical protein